LLATLSGFVGFLATLLATLGMYGVLAYSVQSRTNEIGIRMALGAEPAVIRKMILKETIILLSAGIGIGVPLALGIGTAARAFLYGLKAYDPFTVFSAIGVLAAVAVAASYLPARRASRVDPIVALRYE